MSQSSDRRITFHAIDVPEPFKDPNEIAVAQWPPEHREQAGYGTSTLAGAKGYYVPLPSEDCAPAALPPYAQRR